MNLDSQKLAKEQGANKVSQDLFYSAQDNAGNKSGSDGDATEAKEEKKKRKKRGKRKKKGKQDDISQSDLVHDTSVVLDGDLEEVSGEVADTKPSSQGTKKLYDNEWDQGFEPLRDVLGESFYEDEDSSEDEGMPDYKIGGYHPIHVGEILMDRYVIIQKLGWGHFSTVWLTKDLRYNSYVALKVQKSAQHYVEAAYDEVDILD